MRPFVVPLIAALGLIQVSLPAPATAAPPPRPETMPGAEGSTIYGVPPPTSPNVRPVGIAGHFVNRLDATFGHDRPGATIRNRQDLDRIAWYRYIYGDAATTGDGTDGLYNNYRSRHRDYPDSDPRNLHILTADRLILRGYCGLDTGNRQDCADGHIASGILRFALPIGPGSVVEIRCRMPTGMYAWPAFWLNPGVEAPPLHPGGKPRFSALRWPPEIDIFDQFGFNNTPPGHYLIDGTSTGNNDAAYGNPHDVFLAPGWQDNHFDVTPDLTAADHVYSLDWGRDNHLRFYLDGKLLRDRIYQWNSIDHVPAHLIASLQIGPKFNDLTGITDQGGKPHGWDWPIDYVRVWQRVSQ